jgi:hypothetical protein
VAAEGDRARPRRLQSLADLDGGRHGVRAKTALVHVQGQPQGAARGAAQAERGSLAVLDSSAFSAPKTKQAFELLDDWNRPGSTLVVLAPEDANAALSFRNLKDVAVLTHEDVGVADLLGAASLLMSQTALDALTARAAGSAKVVEAEEAKA